MRTILAIVLVILFLAMIWAEILGFVLTTLVLAAIWSVCGICFAVTGDMFK